VEVGNLGPIQTERRDPLGTRATATLTGLYYPLGFPLHIHTNSRDVLEAAWEAWGGNTPAFDISPFRILVQVLPEGPLSDSPSHRKQDHLYSIVSDPHNFAQIDFNSQFAFALVSERTAADHSWFRWYFLEALAYVMLSQQHIVLVHAACLSRNNSGLLICGPSGAGKSTLSYAAARAGWTWISDDCSCLLPDSPERIVIGRSREARLRPDATRFFPELEQYAPRARPTGTIGIEVPMRELPGVVVGARAPIDKVTFLDRGPGRPSVIRMDREESLDRMLSDLPTYGPEVDAIHDTTVRRLAEAPAYRLRYESLEDGVRLLSEI
jgi:hypothetical protein